MLSSFIAPRSAVISFLSTLILPMVRVLLTGIKNKPPNYSILIIKVYFWCFYSVVAFLTVISGPVLLCSYNSATPSGRNQKFLFSLKCQIVNTSGFSSHIVSVTTARCCQSSVAKSSHRHTQMRGTNSRDIYEFISLYMNTEIWI